MSGWGDDPGREPPTWVIVAFLAAIVVLAFALALR